MSLNGINDGHMLKMCLPAKVRQAHIEIDVKLRTIPYLPDESAEISLVAGLV
ncbi:MAG: hypothetical protein AAB393_10755 [Bacteroidota bacterium]